jgi:transposase
MLKKEQGSEVIGRYSSKGHYDRRFIEQVVREAEQGMPRKAICKQYGVNENTLDSWMKKFGSAAYKQSCRKPFTTTVKRSVVRAVEEGKLSIKEAQVAYGIKGAGTIKEWIKQINQENAELSGITRTMAKKDKQQQTTSQDTEGIDVLKKQLAEAQLKIAALNTLIDVAEEQLKINIRKKPGAKQS